MNSIVVTLMSRSHTSLVPMYRFGNGIIVHVCLGRSFLSYDDAAQPVVMAMARGCLDLLSEFGICRRK